MFFWPISLPFSIIHVDLQIPGKYIDSKGNMVLMNAMCDILQFVVVVHITNESSAILAENCIQHMLMKFGQYHLVIMDDGTSLKFSIVSKSP